ncbi:glycosyltransferase family 2 protein [Solibacillus sp. FSL W7-1324]|uniref:glycosyltransferase family 2 protein n=1 Tax=Solibacillus sp. FSL W7-1324 TaxID=2921701 RepID=UPI0030FA8403
MKTILPKVSIIIPTYNCAQYIELALLSALEQTYQNKEIIIIDDGSTDDTRAVLKKYIKNKDVNYIYQENQGVSQARNTGISVAQGSYVATLDADDTWSNTRLEKMIAFLEGNDYDIAISNFYIVDEYRRRIKSTAAFPEGYTHPSVEKQYSSLLKEATAFALMVVKKDILIDVDCYDVSLKGEAEDYDLWLRLLSEKKKWGYYPEPLVEMMVRVGSLSKGYSKNRKAALKKIFNKQIPIIGHLKAYMYYRYHLGGYRLDMLIVSYREKNIAKINKHIFILMRSPIFSSTILLKKLIQFRRYV